LAVNDPRPGGWLNPQNQSGGKHWRGPLHRLLARDFWNAVGLDPELESSYLLRFRLLPDLLDFLQAPLAGLAGIGCLSKDVSGWPRQLCKAFSLELLFQGFVISGNARNGSGTRLFLESRQNDVVKQIW